MDDYVRKGQWEITIIKLHEENGVKYKVTRRLPNMSVAESKFFDDIDEAKAQVEEWLD